MINTLFYDIVTTLLTVAYLRDLMIVRCTATRESDQVCLCWFDNGSMKPGQSHPALAMEVLAPGVLSPHTKARAACHLF